MQYRSVIASVGYGGGGMIFIIDPRSISIINHRIISIDGCHFGSRQPRPNYRVKRAIGLLLLDYLDSSTELHLLPHTDAIASALPYPHCSSDLAEVV